MNGFVSSVLPGLYFLALAAVLLGVLRRFYDPVSWRPALAFAIVLALFFAPVLFGGRILLPLTILRSVVPFQNLPPDTAPEHHLSGDLVRQIAPWQLSVRRAFTEGRWPLWNPHAGAGMPLLADPQSQALQPLVAVVYPLDVWAGVGVTAALRVLVALVFFYLLLRRQSLSEPAALVGSLAYGCGTFLLLWLGWPIANAAALLPVVLYALARLTPLPCEPDVGAGPRACPGGGTATAQEQSPDLGKIASPASPSPVAGEGTGERATARLEGTPGTPYAPGAPDAPGTPGAPGAPDAPGTPYAPGAPGTPGAPGAPDTPGAPDAPTPGVETPGYLLPPSGWGKERPSGPERIARGFNPWRLGQGFRRRDLALLLAAATSLLLAGHPETALYAAGFSGLFALARAWQLPRRAALRFVAAGAVVAGLGVGLAAPVLLPAAGYLPQTARSAMATALLRPQPVAELWRELRHPGALAFWRVRATERLLPVAAPRAFGDPDRFWGRDNLIEQTSGFVGSAALLAALAGVATLFARRRLPGERLFGLVLLGCLLLVAQPPGFERLIGGLPVIGLTALHKHHRILLLISACLAYLAACQVERTVRGESRRWPVLLGAGILAALLSWAYLSAKPPLDQPVPAFSPIFWLVLQLSLLAVAVPLLLVPRLSRAAPWALAALVAGELVFLSRSANLACSRHLAWPETATSRFLARNLGPARMVGIGSAFLPNFPSVFGFTDVRIDNPSQPRVYAMATSPVSQPGQIVPVFSQPRHPLYDLLAVRYVVAPPGWKIPLPLVQKLSEAWIYERPRALPLLFLPEEVRIFRGGDWRRFLERNRHFARRALVAASPGAEEDWRASGAAPSTIALTGFAPTRLAARAHLTERRLVASSLYQDGHWRALVDGEPVPILWSNGPFASFWLPAGEHEIELLYRPIAFVAGCLLAAAALAAALALCVPPPGAILLRSDRMPEARGNT